MSNKPKILILGSGASALFAAKAVQDFGALSLCASITPFSVPPGAFWFHWVPGDVAEKIKPTDITVHAEGDSRKYMNLQWSINPWGLTSSFPTAAKQVVQGYKPSDVYAVMKPTFFVQLENMLSDREITELCSSYDFVFQTFATEMSKQFQPYKPFFYMGIAEGAEDPTNNYVIYNGLDDRRIWCRKAALWGDVYYEFPKEIELESIQEVMDRREETKNLKYVKLIDLDPFTDPWTLPSSSPKNLHLIGRWAEWNTKRLSHEAYTEVTRNLLLWNPRFKAR